MISFLIKSMLIALPAAKTEASPTPTLQVGTGL